MNKLAISLGSLLVLGLIFFVGLPGILGGKVESRLYEVADQQFYGDYINLEIIDFEGGWFESKARLKATPVGALAAATALSGSGEDGITFDVDLVHGPLLFGDQMSLGLARFINVSELPLPEEMLDGAGNFNIKTILTLELGGGTNLRVSSEPRHYSLVDRSAFRPDEIRVRFDLDWGGFDSYLAMSSGGEHFKMSIDIHNGLIEVTEKEIKSPIQYGAMHLEGDYEMWHGYPAFGTGSFTWEDLDVQIPDPAVNLKFSMENFFVTGTTARAGGKVSHNGALKLNAVYVKAVELQPVEINTLDWALFIGGVNEATYGELLAIQASLTKASIGMGSSRDAERKAETVFAQVLKDGFDFDVPAFDLNMVPGEMHYDHTFNIPEGVIEDINDQASVMAIDYFANVWVDRSLALWIAGFASRAQLAMFGMTPSEEEVRAAAEEAVNGIISEGYFQVNGDRLETKIMLKDGLFSVGRKVVEDMSR